MSAGRIAAAFVAAAVALAPASQTWAGNALTVERDPGVSCTRNPEEVAALVGVAEGARLRCTTKDTLIESFGPGGKLIRSVIWLVITPDDWWAIDDGTGQTVGRGGGGAGSRGVPTPNPVQP